MKKNYDVIIIGTGTAGRAVADKVACSGLKQLLLI